MNLSTRQLMQVAADIRSRLLTFRKSRYRYVEQQLALLTEAMQRLESFRRKLSICGQRGWDLAAAKLMRMGESVLNDVPHHVQEVRRAVDACRAKPFPIKVIFEGLVQADEEFDGLEYRRSHRMLLVETESIELEGVYLGRFQIRLDIPSLADMRYNAMYHVVALDPQPAASNSSVTHPHVTDDQLCPGDASVAIHAALASGRICDFFVLVRSVLRTYNPDSPYVSLDNWFGVNCYDCGRVVDSEDTRWCRVCEQDFCEDCASYCQKCDETTCLGCLKDCSVCGDSTCMNCIHSCPVCEEPLCHSCLTHCPDCEKQLCRLCLEEEQCPCIQENEENEDEEPEGGTEARDEQERAAVNRASVA
ncbi:hypothetical protein ACFL09_00715 [Planctomycetota bacterium]